MSIATYTVFASFGSTTTLFAGAFGRLLLMLVQCAPPSIERYTCGAFIPLPAKPITVAYTVSPVASCASATTDETSKPASD